MSSCSASAGASHGSSSSSSAAFSANFSRSCKHDSKKEKQKDPDKAAAVVVRVLEDSQRVNANGSSSSPFNASNDSCKHKSKKEKQKDPVAAMTRVFGDSPSSTTTTNGSSSSFPSFPSSSIRERCGVGSRTPRPSKLEQAKEANKTQKDKTHKEMSSSSSSSSARNPLPSMAERAAHAASAAAAAAVPQGSTISFALGPKKKPKILTRQQRADLLAKQNVALNAGKQERPAGVAPSLRRSPWCRLPATQLYSFKLYDEEIRFDAEVAKWTEAESVVEKVDNEFPDPFYSSERHDFNIAYNESGGFCAIKSTCSEEALSKMVTTRDFYYKKLNKVKNIVPLIAHQISDESGRLAFPLMGRSMYDEYVRLEDRPAPICGSEHLPLETYRGKDKYLNLTFKDFFTFLKNGMQLLVDLSELGLVHRLICPGHFVFDQEEGVFKLIDCSEVCELAELKPLEFYDMSLQNLACVAPEYLLGAKCSYGIDVWSLGVCLYQLFTGRRLLECIENGDSSCASYLGEVARQIGFPPFELIQSSVQKDDFFELVDGKYVWKAELEQPSASEQGCGEWMQHVREAAVLRKLDQQITEKIVEVLQSMLAHADKRKSAQDILKGLSI